MPWHVHGHVHGGQRFCVSVAEGGGSWHSWLKDVKLEGASHGHQSEAQI